MTKFKFLTLFMFMLSLGVIVSCSDDEEEQQDPCDDITATYDSTVKTIIDGSCAYSGCHDGTGGNSSIPSGANDYTSYAGLKASLDGGSFNTRALVSKNMPPTGAMPELTAAQLEVLTCWHEAGYPES